MSGTEGATYPFWSPHSRFVAFFAGGKLKRIDTNGIWASRGYDVTADGQRFLFSQSTQEETPPPITVVLNWTAEIEKR